MTQNEKLNLAAKCIKAFTGVVGGSLVLEAEHPYITLLVLAIGAVSVEIVIMNKK